MDEEAPHSTLISIFYLENCAIRVGGFLNILVSSQLKTI